MNLISKLQYNISANMSDPSNPTSMSEFFNNINNPEQENLFSHMFLMSQANNATINLQDLPIKRRKNVKQPEDPLKRFQKTLPGFIINFLRRNGPMSEELIVDEVRKEIANLRAASGNKYKINEPKLAVSGVSKMEIFEQESNM